MPERFYNQTTHHRVAGTIEAKQSSNGDLYSDAAWAGLSPRGIMQLQTAQLAADEYVMVVTSVVNSWGGCPTLVSFVWLRRRKPGALSAKTLACQQHVGADTHVAVCVQPAGSCPLLIDDLLLHKPWRPASSDTRPSCLCMHVRRA